LARASYVLFAAAVCAALVKIGGMSGATPVLMQDAPTEPAVAQARTPLEEDLPTRPLLDLPEPGDRPDAETASARLGASFDGGGQSADDPAIFRRPSPTGAPPEPICGNLGNVPQSSRVVFPLPREYFDSYEPGWGSPRPQGGHEGTDLMSPAGTPEFAVADGTVVEVAGANENGWNRLGGYTVMIQAANDIGPIHKGDLFYYAHLDSASVLPVGTEVRAGQRVGFAGDTGEGQEVTRGKFPSHLHLGWYDTDEVGHRSKVESGAMDPYPLLLWLERNGGAVSGGSDASYCEAPQGPVPAADRPGQRPDMDTGDYHDASPSLASGGHDKHHRRNHHTGHADEPVVETNHPTDATPTPPEDNRDHKTQPVENADGDDSREPQDPPDDTGADRPPSPNPDHATDCDVVAGRLGPSPPCEPSNGNGANEDTDPPKSGTPVHPEGDEPPVNPGLPGGKRQPATAAGPPGPPQGDRDADCETRADDRTDGERTSIKPGERPDCVESNPGT
jgi:collagen type III alpha